MKKKNMLFFGEIPGAVAHGVSVSNRININLLKEYFKVFCIQESSLFGSSRTKYLYLRMLEIIILPYQVYQLRKFKFKFLYFTLSLSIFGLLKNLLLLWSAHIFLSCDRSVVHIHRGDLEDFFYSSSFGRFLLVSLFKKLDSVIVLSDSQVKFVSEQFNVRVFVVRNTIEYSNNENPVVKGDNESIRFLFFSNFIQEKGIFDLLEVFYKLNIEIPNTALTLCGMPKNPEILNMIKKNISRNISIIKPIYGDEKYKLFDKHDIFVLPSWIEGQPLSIIEAMYRGLPVVVTDVGVVREMLPKRYPSVAKPRDVTDLFLKMRELMSHTTRKQLSVLLTEKFNEEFSKESHAMQLNEVFQFEKSVPKSH